MYSSANAVPDEAIIVEGTDQPDKDGDIDSARLKQITERFEVHQTVWQPIWDAGLRDDRVVAGEQWDERIKKERLEQGRPCHTYNLIPSFTRQILNKAADEDPRINVVGVESKGPNADRVENLAGTKDYSIADIYSGIIRNIEHTSRAEQVYRTALKHSIEHGFGWFYLINRESKVDPFVQELCIKRVKNSYCITMAPEAEEMDFRDAQDAFKFTDMSRATFESKWPGRAATEFASTTQANRTVWYPNDQIRVAQYFWIDHIADEVVKMNTGEIMYLSKVKDILDELEKDEGIHVVAQKDVKRPQCRWMKLTATQVLDQPLDLPFSAIPIFPVLGEEQMVDGVCQYKSAHRDARDAMFSYNYHRSAATETVALAPKAPIIATAEQIAGYEHMYEKANSANLPYLPYNHIDMDHPPPPPRRDTANVSGFAELQNAASDGQDIQSIIGLHDANLGREGNEKSGKAINARKDQGTLSTSHFPGSLEYAQNQMGRLIVEAIPQIYDTDRVQRVRLPDDSDDYVAINRVVNDEQTGKAVTIHDIGVGKYDVVIQPGGSYQTQQQEKADLQMELLKILPPDKATNIAHIIVKNMGLPGTEEVAKLLRKMLPESLKSEDEKADDLPKGVTQGEDGQLMKDGEPWQPPPTLEQQIQQKQQQIDELEFQSELELAKAKGATAEADLKQAEAKMAEAQSKIAKAEKEMAELQSQGPMQEDSKMRQDFTDGMGKVMETIDGMKAEVKDQIEDAMVEILKVVKGYVDKQITAAGPNQENTNG